MNESSDPLYFVIYWDHAENRWLVMVALKTMSNVTTKKEGWPEDGLEAQLNEMVPPKSKKRHRS